MRGLRRRNAKAGVFWKNPAVYSDPLAERSSRICGTKTGLLILQRPQDRGGTNTKFQSRE